MDTKAAVAAAQLAAPLPVVRKFPDEPARAYTNDKLWQLQDEKVLSLCKLPPDDQWHGTKAENERHCIYATLLMAILAAYWNGNKHGRVGTYPMNDVADPLQYQPRPEDPPSLDGDYYGHNIAAIAVDAKGRVLDFDFNHNDLFNSSAEHAEARLVRRLYSLIQIADAWPAPSPRTMRNEKREAVAETLGNDAVTKPSVVKKNYASLKEITIYTSLESCAQCSGIMALAGVKQVVYLQTDPGTYWIGRILRNLTSDPLRAPLPISGNEIDFDYFAKLDEGYKTFATRNAPGLPSPAFWIDAGGTPDPSTAITSYLCTSEARKLVRQAGDLAAVRLEGPKWRHQNTDGHECPLETCPLSNEEVLMDATQFLAYVVTNGKRGTPHNI